MSDDGPVIQTVEQALVPAPRFDHIQRTGFDPDARRIYLMEPITEEGGPAFVQMLDQLCKVQVYHEGPGKSPVTIQERVELVLNTEGGCMDSMFTVYDAMQQHGNVHVRAFGTVASAGVLLLVAGRKGFRHVGRSCQVMSHAGSFDEGELDYRAARDRRKWADWMVEHWCELMALHTPMDRAWWKRSLATGGERYWLGGEAIVEAGLADVVL